MKPKWIHWKSSSYRFFQIFGALAIRKFRKTAKNRVCHTLYEITAFKDESMFYPRFSFISQLLSRSTRSKIIHILCVRYLIAIAVILLLCPACLPACAIAFLHSSDSCSIASCCLLPSVFSLPFHFLEGLLHLFNTWLQLFWSLPFFSLCLPPIYLAAVTFFFFSKPVDAFSLFFTLHPRTPSALLTSRSLLSPLGSPTW